MALSYAGEDHLRQAAGGKVLGPRGFLMVEDKENAEAFAEESAALSLDLISAAEAVALVPILNPGKIVHASYSSRACDVDTDLLIQDFARTARRNGEIVTGARVTAISHGAEGWTVQTAKGSYSGRILINAAGAWVDKIAAMAGVAPLGFTPYRRSMARLAAPGGQDVSTCPMIYGMGETWYAKPDAGALLVSPAEEDLMEPQDVWPDDMVLAEGLARYEAMVTLPVTRPIATWAGLRTFAPDRVLVIGRDVKRRDFFWLGGQGGFGFQTSAGASQLVADLIAERKPAVDAATVAAVSPARFA